MSLENDFLKNLDRISAKIKKMAEAVKTHKVQPGDTLWGLYQKYQVPPEAIREYNGLRSDILQPGQKIEIPPKSNSFPRKENPDFNLYQEISRAANKAGVDPSLLKALVQKESSGNPNAVSSTGAIGFTQLMPEVIARLGGTIEEAKDPVWNLHAGARWLRISIDEARTLRNVNLGPDEDIVYGLMIYHAGKPAVQEWVNQGRPKGGYGQVGPKTLKYPADIIGMVFQYDKK